MRNDDIGRNRFGFYVLGTQSIHFVHKAFALLNIILMFMAAPFLFTTFTVILTF
jgi:hypothetical protein